MSKGSILSGWVFIVFITMLVMLFWLAMHRIIPSDEYHNSKHIKMREDNHIQKLIDETHRLFHEVANSNLSLNAQAIKELKKLGTATAFVSNYMKELTLELDRLENGLTSCMKEKYDLHSQLDRCRKSEETDIKNDHVKKSEMQTLKGPCDKTNLDKWLVIGIPTVARAHDEEYLLQVLDTLALQLPSDPSDLMYNKIIVNVVNLQINAQPFKTHVVYEKAKHKYSDSQGHPKSIYFDFSEIKEEEILTDPVGISHDIGNANKPGFLVRRQTRNIVTVLRRNLHRGQYYLFLEDDMQFCSNGLLAIQYLLSKSDRYHPNWLAIRASYGMNGIFMHDKDLEVFADYLIKHQARRPPDHLVVEWYAGETIESKKYKQRRANIGFKYNLFNHIGAVSTLRPQLSGAFPGCYNVLEEPTVFAVEAYNRKACPHDDIWPCNIAHAEKFKLDWASQ